MKVFKLILYEKDVESKRKARVAVLLPTFNEEESIGPLLKEIKGLKNYGEMKVYVVDSLSKDKTREIAEYNGAEVIVVKERGKARAVRKAFELIEEDYLVMLDSDLSYSPQDIPKILEALKESEVVLGSRFLGRIEEGAMRTVNRIGNLIFSYTASLLYRKVSDVCSGMWGFRKEAYKKININTNGFDLEVNLFVESVKNNWRIKEVPITYRKREGYSKLSLLDGVPIFLYLLKRRFL